MIVSVYTPASPGAEPGVMVYVTTRVDALPSPRSSNVCTKRTGAAKLDEPSTVR